MNPAVLDVGCAEHTMTQEDHLCDFSQKIVDLLTEEAAQALQAPDHGGLELAACLLRDALKYDALYFRARGVPCEELAKAAQKLRNWDDSAIAKVRIHNEQD